MNNRRSFLRHVSLSAAAFAVPGAFAEALTRTPRQTEGPFYLHTRSGNAERRDGHFQGFGRFLTGSTGEYLFRTIKPVTYPGRTPHIHFAIKLKGRKELVTQCYIEGHPGNPKDVVWRGLPDEKARRSVTVPFAPLPGSRLGELAAKFEIILGVTPEA